MFPVRSLQLNDGVRTKELPFVICYLLLGRYIMNSTKYSTASNSRSYKKLPKDFRHPSENQGKIGHPTQFLGNILYPSEFQIFHIPPH